MTLNFDFKLPEPQFTIDDGFATGEVKFKAMPWAAQYLADAADSKFIDPIAGYIASDASLPKVRTLMRAPRRDRFDLTRW